MINYNIRLNYWQLVFMNLLLASIIILTGYSTFIYGDEKQQDDELLKIDRAFSMWYWFQDFAAKEIKPYLDYEPKIIPKRRNANDILQEQRKNIDFFQNKTDIPEKKKQAVLAKWIHWQKEALGYLKTLKGDTLENNRKKQYDIKTLFKLQEKLIAEYPEDSPPPPQNSSKSKIIQWYKHQTGINDLTKNTYKNLDYKASEFLFISALQLESQDYSLVEAFMRKQKAKANYTDQMHKFYNSFINDNDSDDLKYDFSNNGNSLFLYTETKKIKKLYILNNTTKKFCFYSVRN